MSMDLSIRDILLVLETGASQTAKDYALSFAQQMGAHLSIVAVPHVIMPLAATGDYPYELIATIAEEAKAEAEKTARRVSADAPADVVTEQIAVDGLMGLDHSEIGALARHFDLSITTQAGPDSDTDDRAVIDATLFDTGRPVIVVPFVYKKPATFGHIIVAWDGSAVAARALNDALPLLKRASTIEILRVGNDSATPDTLPGFTIARHLARHDIAATLRVLPQADDVAGAILSYAADSGADLLVMGGSSHSRLRDFIIGSTSRSIMKAMTLPVFMAH